MTTASVPMGHATRYGVAGLLIALPTTFLVAIALLKYVAGVPAPFDAVEPTITPLVTHPVGETVVILAPYLALLLAALPVTRFRFGHGDGRLRVGIEVAAPVLNVLVALLSVAVIAIMAVYYLVENF